MSGQDHQRQREALSAYLLGALNPGEAAELEQHLAGCEECRTELAWLEPAAQVLPESVERIEPPSGLRARVMAEVRADAGDASARSRSAPSGTERRHARGWRSFFLRPATAAAAAVLIAAAALAYAVGGEDSGDSATTVTAGKAPGVTARMVSEGDSGTLHLANLIRLPSNQALQAWVERGKRVERAGPLFEPRADGTAVTAIDDMGGVRTVMVTAEPRGGSALPTSAPLVSVSVSQ
ncbi:MAG TPA: anti-sigma factor [Solirubrobacterales bacterium]